MANNEKKANKLKKFVTDHEEEILIIGYGIGSYLLGVGIGYICGRPSKELREFFKMGTRGVYPCYQPADKVLTAAEFFSPEALEGAEKLGVQHGDRIVGALFSIAKSET